jgi:hypothetical protein
MPAASNAPAAEEDANSGFSYEEDGSSADEAAHSQTAASVASPRKRKREKHEKTS